MRVLPVLNDVLKNVQDPERVCITPIQIGSSVRPILRVEDLRRTGPLRFGGCVPRRFLIPIWEGGRGRWTGARLVRTECLGGISAPMPSEASYSRTPSTTDSNETTDLSASPRTYSMQRRRESFSTSKTVSSCVVRSESRDALVTTPSTLSSLLPTGSSDTSELDWLSGYNTLVRSSIY